MRESSPPQRCPLFPVVVESCDQGGARAAWALKLGPLAHGSRAGAAPAHYYHALTIIDDERPRTRDGDIIALPPTRRPDRARTPPANKGLRMVGLAPSASAVEPLVAEAGIETEILQRLLARSAGIAAWPLTKRGARKLRARSTTSMPNSVPEARAALQTSSSAATSSSSTSSAICPSPTHSGPDALMKDVCDEATDRPDNGDQAALGQRTGNDPTD